MNGKDVKVGMAVVPHDKTVSHFSLDNSPPWNEYGGKEQGFLYVCKAGDDGPGTFRLGATADAKCTNNFRASDFEPAVICVGDTVRVPSGYSFSEGTVCEFYNHDSDTARHIRVASGNTAVWFESDQLELVRKAKPAPERVIISTNMELAARVMWQQPERKKEEAMKRPELSEINERTLVKLRGYGMCVLLACSKSLQFYNGDKIKNSRCPIKEFPGGCLGDLKDDLDSTFDIVATKQYRLQVEALSAVLSNTEPVWDWQEADKSEPVPEITIADVAAKFPDAVLSLNGSRIDLREVGK